MRVLDLFSGIGGFSLGLERAGFETVAFCEVDKKCHKVLQKHWSNVPIFDDVQTLRGVDIDGTVEVICGGFPCQDISVAGNGAGLEGKRSGLWWEFHRLIKEIKPKWAIIENVSALRGRGLDQVLGSISEIGYDAEWHCIPASAVGAPHQRDRIWIVAYPRDNTGWNGISGSAGRDGKGKLEKTLGAPETTETTRSSEASKALANANLSGSGAPQHGVDGKQPETQQERQNEPFAKPSGLSPDVSDTNLTRLERWLSYGILNSQGWEESSDGCAAERSFKWRRGGNGEWTTEPDVGRVANGVPNRVDRLKQLGNAVVPQIPELIGWAIMEYERCQRGL